MGGMFTVLKVRDDPEQSDPKGWFEHPEGTIAGPADAGRMQADGVDPSRATAALPGSRSTR